MTFAPGHTAAAPAMTPRHSASRRTKQRRIAAISRSILRAMNLVLDDIDACHVLKRQHLCRKVACRRAKACRHSPCAMLARSRR